MRDFSTLENENKDKHHFYIIGRNEKALISKLEKHLKFFTLRFEKKFTGKEIVYDVKNDMLSNAGLVLSKQYETKSVYFKVRKINFLPKSVKKRVSKKFYLAECSGKEEPKDYPIQIANAIQSSFSEPFTIDLVSIVRQTVPKIEILVHGNKYQVIGGFGYKATMNFERVVYKDLVTGKKVSKYGVTLIVPATEKEQKYNDEILDVIDRYCSELIPYRSTRFEIAKRLLYPEKIEIEEEKDEDDDTAQD